MKKKLLAAIPLVLVVLVAVSGYVDAYMLKQTEELKNVFIPGQVDCEVNETFDGTTKSVITVNNTSNVDAYIRLRVTSYWVDEDGNIQYEPSPAVNMDVDGSKWIADTANNTYYYKEVVPVGGTTENLLKANYTMLAPQTINGVTCYQVVDVFAEAIQAQPVGAVTSSWGVTISDTTITAVN